MVEVIRRGREELLDKIAIAYKAVLPRIPQRPSKTPVRLVGKLRCCAVGSFNNIRLLLLKFHIPNSELNNFTNFPCWGSSYLGGETLV